MSDKFDPYHEWLGIPASEQPPHHYRLLGIPAFEESPTVIENAADQRMAHLRTFQTGKHAAESQQLLNEIAAARISLLNPGKKAAYDQWLRRNLPQSSPAADRGEAYSFEAGLAAVLESSPTSPSVTTSRRPGKKSQVKATVLMGAAALAILAFGFSALWWAMERDAPHDGALPKADPVASQKNMKEVLPKPPEPSKPKPSNVAATVPKEEPKPDVPKTPPVAERPEPKPEEEAKAVMIPDKTAEAKPAPKDSAAEKPEPDVEKAPAKKVDPPSADEQKRLIAAIDEVYKPRDAKDQAAKVAVAGKLLEDGRKNEANKAEQFVLLRRASEIASDAGEAELMLETVDAMAAAGFNIQPFQVKSFLLKRLAEHGFSRSASQISTFSATCVKLAEDAVAGGAVNEASDVLAVAHSSLAESKRRAQSALRLAKAALARAYTAAREKKVAETQEELEAIDVALSAVTKCAKGIQQARRELAAIQTAQERLKTEPDDPDACLAVGRWSCFYQGDWDEGLKLLAKGSDDALKSLAAAELGSKPAKVEERITRGDTWWEMAEKATGKPKAAMRHRAGHWYQEAMPDLAPGLSKSRLEKRLAQVADEPMPEVGGASARVRPPLAVAPFNEKTALGHQKRWAKYLGVPAVQTNSIGMKLVLIPPGEFDMGSPKELIEEDLRLRGGGGPSFCSERMSGEGPQHRVRITKPYWLGATEVTQEEYQRVMGSNPSRFQEDPKNPVDMVSWDDAVEFCRRLSELPGEKRAKRQYVLPTEAQWEYACRAGSAGPWCFSPQPGPLSAGEAERLLGEVAWFRTIAGGHTHPVAQKQANAWGLYDMHGGVWEWCQDWFDQDYYAKSPADDPAGPPEGAGRVSRGGAWEFPARLCRSALRLYNRSGFHSDWTGLRVCQVPADKPDEQAKPAVASQDAIAPSANSQSTIRNRKSTIPAPPPAVAPFGEQKAKEHQEAWAKHLGLPVVQTNSIGMKLVLIPSGQFLMGSPESERNRSSHEGPQHEVRITRPFCLGLCEVTQEEYEKVTGANPSDFKNGGGRAPVEQLSWEDAQEFCKKLSAMPEEHAAGRHYRLPTEAEWEYACRAGTTTRFGFGDEDGSLGEYAWYKTNADNRTHPVGEKKPNAWGLCDMHGNVWDWCADWYDEKYYSNTVTDDPTGPTSGLARVRRGGSWDHGTGSCRSAFRGSYRPGEHYGHLGLRVALVPVDK